MPSRIIASSLARNSTERAPCSTHFAATCSRFFHTKKYGRHKPRSRQNAFTLCPLRACSETSLRHFVHAFFERLVMSQHCNATRIFTRWGSLSAHEVPTSGFELLRMTFFAYRKPNQEPSALQHPAEVVVERFEYLPLSCCRSRSRTQRVFRYAL